MEIERIRIVIESLFDSKGFKDATANVNQLNQIANKMNVPFDTASKVMSSKLNPALTHTVGGMKELAAIMKTLKIGQMGGFRSGDFLKGASQLDVLTKKLGKLGFEYRTVSDGGMGMVNSITGSKAKMSDVFAAAERKAAVFDMRLLSIMFMGMQLQRTFGGFLSNAIKGYNKLTDATTPAGKAMLRMNASWEFLKFAVVDALGPMIIFFTDLLTGVFDFIGAHPELAAVVGVITGLLTAVGTFLFVGSQMSLFIGAISGMTIPAGIASALGAGGWLLNAAALPIIAAVAVKWAYDNNLFGIKTAIEEFMELVEPINTTVVGKFDDIRTGLIDLATAWVDTWETNMPDALKGGWAVMKVVLDTMYNTIQGIVDATIAARKHFFELTGIGAPPVVEEEKLPMSIAPPSFMPGDYYKSPFEDFIWRAGQPPISISKNDNIIGTKGGFGGGGITLNNTYNISGVTDINSLKRVLEEHDRQIYAEIQRIKIPGV